VKGWLARNRELERLLNELIHRLAADHGGVKPHSRQVVLDRLTEKFVSRLENLEIVVDVRFPIGMYHELCLNFARYA
jgi:hypothetical protein